MENQKTAMLLLKEDLLETIITGKEDLDKIKDVNIKSACKTTLETTIQDIINRIDNELFEIEKNQMRKMYNSGGKYASLIESEDFFNDDYTQSLE